MPKRAEADHAQTGDPLRISPAALPGGIRRLELYKEVRPHVSGAGEPEPCGAASWFDEAHIEQLIRSGKVDEISSAAENRH